MKSPPRVWLAIAAATLAVVSWQFFPKPGPGQSVQDELAKSGIILAFRPDIRSPAAISETRHYLLSSTADAARTREVADAVEALHAAYFSLFPPPSKGKSPSRKLHLFLYRDQEEFLRNNRSSPWAEAYYLKPTCHAYYADAGRNPYHWMLHEATHQLGREVSRFRKRKWSDEGLATYFGSSLLRDKVLMPGKIDAAAYPIWWLSSLQLSGNIDQDIADGKIIPLDQLISGTGGPDINAHVNLYYIEYWSLTHFLFHHEQGKYSAAYKRLVAGDATLEAFEAGIGPLSRIQGEWYGYLQDRIAEQSGHPKR